MGDDPGAVPPRSLAQVDDDVVPLPVGRHREGDLLVPRTPRLVPIRHPEDLALSASIDATAEAIDSHPDAERTGEPGCERRDGHREIAIRAARLDVQYRSLGTAHGDVVPLAEAILWRVEL